MFEAERMASELIRHHRPGHHGNKASPRPAPKDTDSHIPEPPKLRASCDGCYLSKVKCSKETPICSRWYVCSEHYYFIAQNLRESGDADSYNTNSVGHGIACKCVSQEN